MPNQLSLNLITIKKAPFKEKLAAAKAAGFSAVGLWPDELEEEIRRGTSAAKIVELLKQNNLEVAEMCALMGWMGAQGEARQKAFAHAARVLALCESVNCPVVVACACFGTCDLDDAITDFRDLCQLAAKHKVRCALEFVGGVPQFHDVKSAWEVAEAADQPNGGIMVDSFHFYRGNSTLAQLDAVPDEKLYLMHINDAQDLPKHELTGANQVYPGLGVIPLEEIVALHRKKNYQGYYSLEIANPDYWEVDPKLVAREGARALRKLGIE